MKKLQLFFCLGLVLFELHCGGILSSLGVQGSKETGEKKEVKKKAVTFEEFLEKI